MATGDFGRYAQLPDEIREKFMWLCQDVASLSEKWGFYIRLFGNPADRALLSDTANASFVILEESIRIDMTMAICRLSDPLMSCGKENLNFSTLVDYFVQDTLLENLVKDFRDACKDVRTHRNKLVGHSDLNTRLEPDKNLLPPVGKPAIDAIVGKAAMILNHVTSTQGLAPLYFDVSAIGGASDLLYWLKTGWAAHQKEIRENLGGQ
jgi:hypothetical protein